MLGKKILITAAAVGLAGVTFGFANAALAAPPYWAPAHGWRAHHYYYAPRPVYVVPAPRVYYAPPPPVAYYPVPVPAPVYRPVPVYPAAPAYPAGPTGGISIRLNFPL
jgi:hypothetical protein